MPCNVIRKVKLIGLVGAAALSLALAAPALADTATTTVAEGELTFGITADAVLKIETSSGPDPVYKHSYPQHVFGTFIISVNDERGTEAGWTINMSSTAFVDSETDNEIPVENFSQTLAPFVTFVEGADDATTVRAKGQGANLGTAHIILDALPGNGDGSYTAEVPVTLTIPMRTPPGTYVATVTLTEAAAPIS